MSRKFIYYATPEELKEFLAQLGYETEDLYYASGEGPFGFAVKDTHIQVGSDPVVKHDAINPPTVVAYGTISMRGTPVATGAAEKAKRSVEVYQKLHRRFSKPQSENDQRKWLSTFTESRHFRYHAPTNLLRNYLEELGLKPQDYYEPGGKNVEGFTVLNGTVRVLPDSTDQDPRMEHGKVGVYIPPTRNYINPRSLQLYEKLYERFHQVDE